MQTVSILLWSYRSATDNIECNTCNFLSSGQEYVTNTYIKITLIARHMNHDNELIQDNGLCSKLININKSAIL